MAKSPKKTKSSNGRSRYLRVFLVFFILLIIVAGFVLFFWFTTRGLFSKNEHFTLKYIEVESPGYWNGRNAEILAYLNKNLIPGEEGDKSIVPGSANLFELDIPEIREITETIPSVARAEVSRDLPDTLKIKIEERIPRAFLDRKNSRWVVDSNAIVMSRKSCLDLDDNLPVIKNYRKPRSIHEGMELPVLQPAIDLIMLTKTDFPDIRIVGISMKDPGELMFVLFYKGKPDFPYIATMPVRKDLYSLMNVLRSTLISINEKGDSRRYINLLYDGNVILKK